MQFGCRDSNTTMNLRAWIKTEWLPHAYEDLEAWGSQQSSRVCPVLLRRLRHCHQVLRTDAVSVGLKLPTVNQASSEI